MKKRRQFGLFLILLIIALFLVLVGGTGSVLAFSQFEQLSTSPQDPQLLQRMESYALTMTIFGGLAAIGFGLILVLFFRAAHSSILLHRETKALRQRTEAAEQLNQKLQSIAHHQRLATIGTLTASIAHEFNNLLTPIMGYSMLALEKLPADADGLYDDLLEIYQSSCKAKQIISRLNDLSRKNTGSAFRTVSLDDLVKRTLDVATPAKPVNTQVQLDLNCWDQRVHANEIQLSQLLLNLILNSFQALQEREGLVSLRTYYDADNVHLEIQDNGPGIPEAIQNRVFEPFFTTKEAGKGTGLGLAIVAQVVEDHKGSIDLHSKEGHGTRIHVCLPRHSAYPEADFDKP